jgi:hypothetical protein
MVSVLTTHPEIIVIILTHFKLRIFNYYIK